MPLDAFRRRVRLYDDLAWAHAKFGVQPNPYPTANWLTPKVVEDYDPADFVDLPAYERDRLSSLVSRFREIAERTAQSPGDVQDAAGLLRDIAGVLEADRYGGEDGRRVGKLIERAVAGQLPNWVADFRFETGEDSTGDPALWVWVLMRDEVADAVSDDEVSAVRQRLFDAARRVNPERWPYIRFRTVAEQAELDATPVGRP